MPCAARCVMEHESVQMDLWTEYVDTAGRSAVLPGELWMFSKGRIDEDREAKDNSVYKRDGG